MKYPKTPFSTSLSDNAKEAELRLRNIFQWKKQRPPVWLLAIVIALTVGCGALFTMQPKTVITPENFFDHYQDQFQDYQYPNNLEDGTPILVDSFSFGDRTLTVESIPENEVEALVLENYYCEMSGESERLEKLMGSEHMQISANNGSNQEPRFQSITLHALDAITREDFTDEGPYFSPYEHPSQFYIQELSEKATEYGLTEYVLVYVDLTWQYTDEMYALGPQLDNGRYERIYLAGKAGKNTPWRLYDIYWWELTQGRDPKDVTLHQFKSQIDTSEFDARGGAVQQLLASIPVRDYTLNIAHFYDDYPHNAYVFGVMDGEGQLVGKVFETRTTGGGFTFGSFTGEDGAPRIRYTTSTMHQAYSSGTAGLMEVTEDGQLNWLWPVTGDIRDKDSRYLEHYNEYWSEFKPLMTSFGVDLFHLNEDFGPYRDSPPQWEYYHSVIFHTTPEAQLPVPVYEKVRIWLEEFTRSQYNPYDEVNSSAQWKIQSLTPSDGVYLDESATGMAMYDLVALANDNNDLYFTAELMFNHSTGELDPYPNRVKMGTYDQVFGGDYYAEERNALITDALLARDPDRTPVFTDDASQVAEDQVAVTNTEFLGDAPMYETIGEAWNIDLHYPNGHTASDTLILVRSGYDSSYQGAVGFVSFDTAGMTIESIIHQMEFNLMDIEVALWRDQQYFPVGPGSSINCFRPAYDGEAEVETHDDWEPIYAPGSYWEVYRRDGFTALSYHNADTNHSHVYTADITRNDMATQRGIRVGSTREEVLAAYPELKDTDYWNYDDIVAREDDLLWQTDGAPQGDYLWYCKNEEGWGAALIFFFEEDVVSHIRLNNMFN